MILQSTKLQNCSPQFLSELPQTLQTCRGRVVVCGQMLQAIAEHVQKCIAFLQCILECQICSMAVDIHSYKGSMPCYLLLQLRQRTKEANQARKCSLNAAL